MKRASLAVDLMSRQALWAAAFNYMDVCRWETQHTVQERDAALKNLKSVLLELHARGEQLQLTLDAGTAPLVYESPNAA